MSITVRRLGAADQSLLSNVAPDVFDDPIVPASAKKFLGDPNCMLVAALDESRDNLVVGFASAMTYLHPDKAAPEMVILEVGVDDAYQKRGVGKEIMKVLLAEARDVGCKLAWLATEAENAAALALYKSAGGKPPEACIHVDFDLKGDG